MFDKGLKKKTVRTGSDGVDPIRRLDGNGLTHDVDQSNRYFGSFSKDNTFGSNNHLRSNDSGEALYGKRGDDHIFGGNKVAPENEPTQHESIIIVSKQFTSVNARAESQRESEFHEVKHHKETPEREIAWAKDEHKHEDGLRPKKATSNNGENWPWGSDGNHYFTGPGFDQLEFEFGDEYDNTIDGGYCNDWLFGGGGSSGPYRGAKGSLFEGGIRVPSIVSWPDKIPQGEIRSQMATGCDWHPTFSEYCGAKLPLGRKLDGKSLVEVIADARAPSPHKTFYWQLGQQAVVREGNWKLLMSPRDHNRPEGREPSGKLFLANMAEDPGESKNLAKDHPEVVTRLTRLKKTFADEVKRPRDN